MLFNSFDFLIFFPTVWCLYVWLKNTHKQNFLLLIASYTFYGFWDWRFLSLLWISTIVDFFCGNAMKKYPDRKKLFLLCSIFTNLGILGFFKYFDFFSSSAIKMLSAFGLQPDVPTLNLILPVGISFYTFQTLGYTIDVYRGKIKPTTDFLSFAIYVAYFPQLVAGPIERADRLLPQIQKARRINFQDIGDGLELCLMGYFKKVVIADSVAPIVEKCFSAPSELNWVSLVAGAYLFALQIYGDFAGYTDIARGVSRLFGIKLCTNFKQPYLSSNITEFWRRWHISLSSWLRDYLYIPLGGNRKGQIRTYLNNMATMLLGGLWHGAAWTFVILGGLHGLYLAIHKLILGGRKLAPTIPDRKSTLKLANLVKIFITFNLVCLGWVFFRADSFATAFKYIGGIIFFQSGDLYDASILYVLFLGGLSLLIDALCFFQNRETPFMSGSKPLFTGAAYALLLFLILCVGEGNEQPFIYFQF
jgi:D-alanyl-lipoteichoic acid acyltransferase DltB (MBOAT superfamily)